MLSTALAHFGRYAPQQLGSMHGSGKLPARASSTISETCDIAQGDLPGFLASFPIPEAAHLRDIATGAEPSNFYGKQARGVGVFCSQIPCAGVLLRLGSDVCPRLTHQRGLKSTRDGQRLALRHVP